MTEREQLDRIFGEDGTTEGDRRALADRQSREAWDASGRDAFLLMMEEFRQYAMRQPGVTPTTTFYLQLRNGWELEMRFRPSTEEHSRLSWTRNPEEP